MRPTARRRTLTVALLALAACAAPRPLRPAAEPALRIGTSGDYPPFSVRAADGAYDGFDVEVALAYAAARGRRVEWVPFRWPELAARLAAGEFDVAMSGITVRGDRLLTGHLTAAVARADAVVLARHAGGVDLDRPGRRIAVNRGGHLEQIARARLTAATIVTVDDNRRLPELLRSREVDAIVTDSVEAATFDPGAFTVVARLTHDRKAYWVAPGRAALAEDLDGWLLDRERDGTLPRLRAVALRVQDGPSLTPEVERVVDLAARRLLLMPLVAAAKRAAGLPIVDATREGAVVERMAERAAAAGLDADAARRLARAEIAAARAVQEATPPSPGDPPSLAALRSGIDALDAALVRALVGARASGNPAAVAVAVAASARLGGPALAAALREDAEVPGFDDGHANAIGGALLDLLRSRP